MTDIKKGHRIGIFSLVMINVAAALSMQPIPERAEYGYEIIFYMILSCICFFIPSALVSAELTSGWPKKGGVFLWVKEAFGPKWGLIAVFMQWVANLPWFPSLFAFMAASLAYIFNPALATNKLFVITVIWVATWAATFFNFHSMKLSSFLSSSGVILGAIIPGSALIILGIIHVFLGKPLAIPFSAGALIPKINNLDQLMLLSGLLIAGAELSAVHITDVHNPKINFPKAIFIACGVIIFLSITGPLSLVIVVPVEKLSLSAGVMQGFEHLLDIHGIKWTAPILAGLLVYGAFTRAVTWMVGPSKGILEAAKDGHFPKFMQKKNKHGMPIGALIVQSIISTILSLVVLVMPTISGAFWIMLSLSWQFHMIMYLFIFASAIKLRYSQPNIERSFKIPGGKIGIWVVSGAPIIVLFFIIIFSFIPTRAIRESGMAAMIAYIMFHVVGIIVFIGIPIFLYERNKKIKAALSIK